MRHSPSARLLALMLMGSLLGCQQTEPSSPEPSAPVSPAPAVTAPASESVPVSEIIQAMGERAASLKQANLYQPRTFDLQVELLPQERVSLTTYHANGYTFFDLEVMDPSETFDFWVKNGDDHGKSLYLSFFDVNGHDQAIIEVSFTRFAYEEGERHGYAHLYGVFKQRAQAYQALDSVVASINGSTTPLKESLDVAPLGGLAKLLRVK